MLPLEALQRLELGIEQIPDLIADRRLAAVGAALVVVVERPELLEPVQRAALVVPQGVLLKVAVNQRPEPLLQAVRVEAEEALQAVVVRVPRVLLRQLAELLVHLRVESAAEKVGPEAEEGVHLLAVTRAQPPALVDAPLVERPVLLLLEAVILEQRVGRVLERGDVPRGSPVLGAPRRRPVVYAPAALAERGAPLAR